jgi:hypothetical protein
VRVVTHDKTGLLQIKGYNVVEADKNRQSLNRSDIVGRPLNVFWP